MNGLFGHGMLCRYKKNRTARILHEYYSKTFFLLTINSFHIFQIEFACFLFEERKVLTKVIIPGDLSLKTGVHKALIRSLDRLQNIPRLFPPRRDLLAKLNSQKTIFLLNIRFFQNPVYFTVCFYNANKIKIRQYFLDT